MIPRPAQYLLRIDDLCPTVSQKRWRRILGLIRSEPRTAYEIAQALWGNVAVTQAYLTLSEVLGHVDLLLEQGDVHEVDDAGVTRFEAVEKKD